MVTNNTASLLHIEFHTICPQRLIDLFICTYGFTLVATRTTCYYSQWLLQSHQCQLIISTTSDIPNSNNTLVNKDDYDILTTLLNDKTLQTLVANRDTVFNVALAVTSLQSVLDRNPDIQVIVPRHEASDEYGSIEYACIKSCVGNVVHSIIDMSNYSGPYLPGFTPVTNHSHEQQQSNRNMMHSIDHVAFAVLRNSAPLAIAWYERVLGLRRFAMNEEDDPFHGFSVRVGSMGMRMFSSVYWKCAETGCADTTTKLKFVFAESLIDINSGLSDQITTFIRRHNGQPGIQHLALACAKDIKEVVRTTKANGAEFLTPCGSYYSPENNGRIIEAAGESAAEFRELGILLDDEADVQDENNISAKLTQKILLQIFTRSIFDNDTFFLELIERRGASGFGGGNVRTLWKIVEQQMNHAKQL